TAACRWLRSPISWASRIRAISFGRSSAGSRLRRANFVAGFERTRCANDSRVRCSITAGRRKSQLSRRGERVRGQSELRGRELTCHLDAVAAEPTEHLLHAVRHQQKALDDPYYTYRTRHEVAALRRKGRPFAGDSLRTSGEQR